MRRRRSLARTMGRTALIAGTATAVSGHVAARQHARFGQQGAPAGQPAPTEAPPLDVVEELKRFAELRDKGILTEEEFAAQKARLLGG